MSEAQNADMASRIRALVGDHVYDYTEWDTGVRKCRQRHGLAGRSAVCSRAWLREQFPDLFPSSERIPPAQD